MNRCIFCKKQTSNQYSYFMASYADSVREKISVFACTKCLNKHSVVIPSIVTLFFMLSLLGNIGQMSSGEKDVEVRPIIVVSVLTLVFLFWTLYKVYCIVVDKPLSEESAAKKLIRKAKKVNPSNFYFTPAENELTHKEEKEVKSVGPIKRVVTQEPAMQSKIAPQKPILPPTPKSGTFKFKVISKYTAFGGVFVEGVMEQGNQLSVGDLLYVYNEHGKTKYEKIKVTAINNESSIPVKTIKAGEGTFRDGLYAAIRLEGVWNIGDFEINDIFSIEKLDFKTPIQEDSPIIEKVLPQAKTYNDANRKTHIDMATNDLCSICGSAALGGNLEKSREWIRNVGQDLYDAHGFSAMQEVFINVKNRYPMFQAKLSSIWDGVGGWAD